MKIHQLELRQEREQLMVFRAGLANRAAAEDWMSAMHHQRRFKEKCIRIGIRSSVVIEVGPILDANSGMDEPFDDDLGRRGNLEISACDHLERLLLQSTSQIEFVHPRGTRPSCGHDGGLRRSNRHRHGQRGILRLCIRDMAGQIAPL